jgi:solute carrier family 25 folate transporter 32
MLSTGKDTPGAYQSIAHGAKHIWATEGLKGFYRGLFPSLFGVTHGSIQFSAYERLKNWRTAVIDAQSVEEIARDGTVVAKKTAELGNIDYLTLSAISKIFAGSITYPYQIVRARLQLYDANDKYKNGRDVVKKVYAKEGIAGFYKGYASLALLN